MFALCSLIPSGAVGQAARTIEHVVHISHDSRHVPGAQILVEAARFTEHDPHISDSRHVPGVQILVEAARIFEHAAHISDSRHVPGAQILIELAHVHKQLPHISDLLGAPLADVSILSLGRHGILTPCVDGLFDVGVGSGQPGQPDLLDAQHHHGRSLSNTNTRQSLHPKQYHTHSPP